MLKSIVLIITVWKIVTAGSGSTTTPAPTSADCDCASEEFVSKAVNSLFSAAVAQLQWTVRDHVKSVQSVVSSRLRQIKHSCDELTQCPDNKANSPSCASDEFVSDVLSSTVNYAVAQLQRTMQCEAKFMQSFLQGQNNIISCYNSGFKYYLETGSCYKLYNENATWPEANTTCVTTGAHLAIPNSAEEMRILSDMAEMKRDGCHNSLMWAYIGIYKDPKGVWRTVTDETLQDAGYDTWRSEYPTNDDESRQYAAVYKGALVNMSVKNYYICEM